MEVQCLEVGAFGTNCYVVRDEATGEGLVIDPGAEPERIAAACREVELEPAYIANTHAHADHVGAAAALKEVFPRARVCIGRGEEELLGRPMGPLAFLLRLDDPPDPELLLEDGARLEVGRLVLRVVTTPGHTPRSVCFVAESEDPAVVFCGDLVFHAGVGRTDLPGGDWNALERSIAERIFSMPDGTVLLPGHGPATTVGAEKARGIVSAP